MSNQLLKANAVAERLNISRSQAFILMRNGELPVIRIGKLVRVRPDDLEMFIINKISVDPEEALKAKLAAVTARVENEQSTVPQRKINHVQS